MFGNKKTEIQQSQIGLPSHDGMTFIGPECEFTGRLVLKGDICIEGSFTGELEVRGRLVVAPSGSVFSESAVCSDAEVSGKVSGPFTVLGQLRIRQGGIVTGDIASAELTIEQGGAFNGNSRTLTSEEAAQPRGQFGASETVTDVPKGSRTASKASEVTGAAPQ